MENRNIGIRLEGQDIPVDAFLDAAKSFCGLLSDLDDAVPGGVEPLNWRIAGMSLGSANLTIEPMPKGESGGDRGDTVIATALSGLATIEQEGRRPEHFTDDALKKAKDLVRGIDGAIDDISLFGNTRGGSVRTLTLTTRTADNVHRLLGTAYAAAGSIEGTLETLSIHGGPMFAVYDVMTARRIQCNCDRKTLDRLLTHLGSRVSVKGELRFNRRGEPSTVNVESFDPLGGNELPQAEHLRGSFAGDKVKLDEWSDYIRKR